MSLSQKLKKELPSGYWKIFFKNFSNFSERLPLRFFNELFSMNLKKKVVRDLKTLKDNLQRNQFPSKVIPYENEVIYL